ncbi:MAG: glycosyltransferase family 4 protein [Geminicoccaceae bacterium]|nr:glycosyltransferase family 4 protein [Geminicoccaceae bacterium]
MLRLAILTSHPIQYQAPLFRALARRLDLEVFFAHRQSPEQQAAAGFSTAFDWDVDLLEGYSSRFLENRARRPGVDRFRGCDTPEIGSIIARGRFDAVLVTGWHLLCYWQAIRACRRLRTPVLVRGDSQLVSPRSRSKRLVKAGLHRWLVRQFDGFLHVGTRNRAYLLHYGARPERLFFTPHFVDNPWFAERARAAAAERDAFRARLGIGANERVILFAGRLVPFKRVEDVIRATARLAAGEVPAVRLLIAGSGPLQADLERLAASSRAPVTFAGFRNQTELPACYDLAELLVLGSTGAETWGLVVNEAMASGTPAVVSDAVGCAPDLVDGRTGQTVPVGDVPALCHAIQATLGSKDDPAVQAALAAKMSTYSVETAVAGVLAALEQVTSA